VHFVEFNVDDFGRARVKWPKGMLPNSAWQMDVDMAIRSNELIITVERIQLERGSFKQICHACFFDDFKIKQEILNIVETRGKLHNPYTDTGGIFAGRIRAIGGSYKLREDYSEGDLVISLSSTTMLPLALREITCIDYSSGQIEVKGEAILYGECMLAKANDKVPLQIALAAFEESGSVFHVNKLVAVQGKRFLIVGNNAFSMILYALAVREARNNDCVVVCVFDDCLIDDSAAVVAMLTSVFDECVSMDTVHPFSNLEKLEPYSDALFDLTVNCSDIQGSEFINALMVKPGGTVVFTGMANNYKETVFITEVLRKELVILNADGYLEGYVSFMENLLLANAAILLAAISCGSSIPVVQHGLRGSHVVALEKENNYSAAKILETGFIYKSTQMAQVVDDLLRAANYDCNVLLCGETGTGKEKALDIIYRNSARGCFPCVKINCSAIPGELMEAELFGYAQGAFTGASSGGRDGIFVAADRGLLFLDEVTELAPNLQAKLLRVLQENEFYKVGGNKPIRVNVRIIAATNSNIFEMVRTGRFREDLFYRLNVLKIDIPPLRDRPEDIIPLANYFTAKYAAEFDIERSITSEGMLILREHAWPGNVRELENFIQKLLINSDETIITSTQVLREIYRSHQFEGLEEKNAFFKQLPGMTLQKTVKLIEQEMISLALSQGGSTRAAAKILGISQTQLLRKKSNFNRLDTSR
jgi:transcriptional regulator with PAS, ATPase and Fis domain